MRPLGVVVALEAESQTLAGSRVALHSQRAVSRDLVVRCCGMGASRAEGAARALGPEVSALVSWGVAAGLREGFSVGTVVLGEAVINRQGVRFFSPGPWLDALEATLSKGKAAVARAVISEAPEALESAQAKTQLAKLTGGDTADMESAAVAAVARELNLPFIVVRAISDTHLDSLPTCVARALDEQGLVRHGVLLRSLIARPRELPALARLGINFHRALGALREVTTLAPQLAFPVKMSPNPKS